MRAPGPSEAGVWARRCPLRERSARGEAATALINVVDVSPVVWGGRGTSHVGAIGAATRVFQTACAPPSLRVEAHAQGPAGDAPTAFPTTLRAHPGTDDGETQATTTETTRKPPCPNTTRSDR